MATSSGRVGMSTIMFVINIANNILVNIRAVTDCYLVAFLNVFYNNAWHYKFSPILKMYILFKICYSNTAMGISPFQLIEIFWNSGLMLVTQHRLHSAGDITIMDPAFFIAESKQYTAQCETIIALKWWGASFKKNRTFLRFTWRHIDRCIKMVISDRHCLIKKGV